MGLVYDSATGGTCPRCRNRRELRNGKPVTVVFDLPLRADEAAALASKLKAACGSGGTAKDGCIELQGDHRDKVVAFLQQAGHAVKLAGG
jgi:translation initiation factor 1